MSKMIRVRVASVVFAASALVGGGAVAAAAVTPPPPPPITLHCVGGGMYVIPSSTPAADRAYLISVLVTRYHVCHL